MACLTNAAHLTRLDSWPFRGQGQQRSWLQVRASSMEEETSNKKKKPVTRRKQAQTSAEQGSSSSSSSSSRKGQREVEAADSGPGPVAPEMQGGSSEIEMQGPVDNELDKRAWKKPFPWLGREFEETFVRPRNEPNPLVCCFGEAMEDFVPTVRVCPVQMDPDSYCSWKGLQWTPPEFARSPGTTAANVAISIARLAGKVAFIGKVGEDELGQQLLETLRSNKVETKGVRADAALSTSVSRVNLVRQGKRKISMPCAQQSAQNCVDASEVDVDILKEARLFHFSSLSLTNDNLARTLMWALETARSFGSVIFFDVNLALPLWTSPQATWASIDSAWRMSDVIKINKVELEYLINDEGLALRLLDTDQPANNWDEYLARRNQRFEYHYTREQIAPIWTDNIKMLLVTDGTFRMHYYTPSFHGDVVGTEDVIAAAQTCDRTGSGDTISAAMIRKLVAQPYIFHDQEKLEKALRFAIAAGVISQWTMGAVRGFPTESAAQNLTEQMFPLSQVM